MTTRTLSAGNFYLRASCEAAGAAAGLCIGMSRQACALIDNLIRLVSLEEASFCIWRKPCVWASN